MRADAIPLEPVGSSVRLTPEAIARLFGAGYRLRGAERVELMQRGQRLALIDAQRGDALVLTLDAVDRAALTTGSCRLRGPKGVLDAPMAMTIPPRLVVPEGLRRAWGLEADQHTTVAVGPVAFQTMIADGPALALRVDRGLLLAAGNAETARWLPTVAWPAAPETRPEPEAPRSLRVITENDVRQARMRRQRLHVAPGQLVTPAARALGHELGVFDEDPAREP